MNGDVIDTWSWHMPFIDSYQCRIIEKILDWDGDVTYIRGNHETNTYLVSQILPLPMLDQEEYYTLEGKKILITHGHVFDKFKTDKFLAYRYLCSMLHKLEHHTRLASGLFHLVDRFSYFSVRRFRDRIFKQLKTKYYGVICGHTHIPQIWDYYGKFMYYNDGDFVQHQSALVETLGGEIKLI